MSLTCPICHNVYLSSGKDDSFQSFYPEKIVNKYRIYSRIPDHDITKLTRKKGLGLDI